MIVRRMKAAQAQAYVEKHFADFAEWRQLRIRLMLMRGRERTGVKDANGCAIFTGDILKSRHNEYFPEVFSLVNWDENKAAFTHGANSVPAADLARSTWKIQRSAPSLTTFTKTQNCS